MLKRKILAELLGSMVLVVVAISPTILAYDILGSSIQLAVLYDGVAVGCVLFALVESLGPISGCHINPAVTLAMVATKDLDAKTGVAYILAQMSGGLLGVLCSSLMFYGLSPKYSKLSSLLTISSISRPSGCYFAEYLWTFILVLTVYGCSRNGSRFTGLAVGLLVGGAIITTSSTMFANPQVTVARIFTPAIAGIRPLDAAFFVLAEVLGALTAAKLSKHLFG